MSLKAFFVAERQMPLVMAAVFLPSLGVVILTAGGFGALILLGYGIGTLSVGYGVISLALPAAVRKHAAVLSPAAGILTVSALTAFWVRLGLPVIWAPALWLGLAAAGVLCLWSDCAFRGNSPVKYGGTLVALSVLICAIYFLPSARNDAVLRRDGSFNWIYVDTQFFHAMAANIERGDGPPTSPGTATAELLYHFGPYAPAAAISLVTHLDLGDAYARVTRGSSLWALVLSCFGLGTLLSLKATGEKFGGIMSVAGLFFYGSLLSLFTNETNSSSHVTGAILLTLPEVDVLGQGGPFSHLILGHSVLHGLGAITAVMGLCFVAREYGPVLSWRVAPLLALPALAVGVNSVAALYCLAVVGILMFWGRLGQPRSWALITLMLCLFLIAWKIMGYNNSGTATLTTMNRDLGWQWWTVAVWFMVGLGFRIVGFRWISRRLQEPISALVLASVLGLLPFTLLLLFENGQQRYGVYFLQALLSIFAFSRLPSGCWRSAERSKWAADWLRLALKGLILLMASGLLIGIVGHVALGHSGITNFRTKMFLSLPVLGLLAAMSAINGRNRCYSIVSSAFLMGLLLIGFLAWVTPWLNFGIGRMNMDITIPAGEVRGLKRLSELAAPSERFATNKHAVNKFVSLRERSYAYGILSARPVLLEGYSLLEQYAPREESDSSRLKALLQANDLMFTTTDPETLHEIAKIWHVRWLVARPGTDIALPRPLPTWLVEQQECGDLKIYRVN